MIRPLVTLLISLPGLCLADSEGLRSFVQGSYVMIGKAPESDRTYHGTVQIYETDGELTVLRSIGGTTTRGTASIEPALGGETPVLRMRFIEDEVELEQTCMVYGDLDNYARISCYLYQPGLATDQPGLEALFVDHAGQ